MEKETDRFKAVDGIGEEFTVIEYREVREQRDLEGKISTTYGLPRLALDDGSAVTPIDDELFKIVQTKTIIRRVR